MPSRMLWKIELVSGLLAGILGLVVPGYALLVADYPLAREVGGASALLILVAIVMVIPLTAFLDSQFHWLWSAEVNLGLLWTAALALWGLVLAIYPLVDVYLLPSALLATIAAVAGSWADAQGRLRVG
jgi:hypothetical protein